MSRLYDLNSLVPGIEDVVLKYNGADYVIPGDLDSETVFEFMTLFDDMVGFQAEAQAVLASESESKALEAKDTLRRLTTTIEEKLFTVLKIRQPDLKAYPFGQQSTMTVVGIVLEAMGIGRSAAPESPKDPPKPPATRKKKTTTTTRTKRATASPRRSGARRSR